MNRRRIGLIAGFVLTIVSGVSNGEQMWVVQSDTPFPDVLPPCQNLVRWQTNLLVHNPSTEAIEVTLLDVSNGNMSPDATPLTVLPGTTASLRGLNPAGLNWSPVEYAPLWVNKLDVPEQAVVANRAQSVILEMLTSDPNPPCSNSRTLVSAGLPLRVFRGLVPAGVTQYHLGSDIGDFGQFFRTDSRINVGVYNDAAEEAAVSVEVRCSPELGAGVPDLLVAAGTIRVPAHSVTQSTVVASTKMNSCPLFGPAPYHVVVTSDQPGFSFATAISNDELPRFPAATSITY